MSDFYLSSRIDDAERRIAKLEEQAEPPGCLWVLFGYCLASAGMVFLGIPLINHLGPIIEDYHREMRTIEQLLELLPWL